MEFTDVIRRRRMVRRFVDRPLPSDVVERIVSNAMRVPSAGFSQGWAFLALTEEEDRKRFWPFVPNQAGYSPEIMHAPLVVIPLAHKGPYLEKYDRVVDGEDAWPAPYWFVDTGMSALMILLTAVDEGLGGFLFWIVPSADELIVSSAPCCVPR
jgi:nitroreductase